MPSSLNELPYVGASNDSTLRVSSFNVTTDNITATYGLGRALNNERFIATRAASQDVHLIQTSGANSVTGMMRPSTAKKTVTKHVEFNIFPEEYFDKHEDSISLYAANPVVAGQLKAWNRAEYLDFKTWEAVSITGRCLTHKIKYTKDGRDITNQMVFGSSKGPSGCQQIWVQSVSILPANLGGIRG